MGGSSYIAYTGDSASCIPSWSALRSRSDTPKTSFLRRHLDLVPHRDKSSVRVDDQSLVFPKGAPGHRPTALESMRLEEEGELEAEEEAAAEAAADEAGDGDGDADAED